MSSTAIQPRTAESFRNSLLAEYEPEGAVELAFLDTVVEHWDALTQARELRTRLFTNDLELCLFGPDAKKFEKIERYVAKCERNFARAVRELQSAQSARRRAELAVARKTESEARIAAKRASAQLDTAMMARLCPPRSSSRNRKCRQAVATNWRRSSPLPPARTSPFVSSGALCRYAPPPFSSRLPMPLRQAP
jgi:hypothetical protein